MGYYRKTHIFISNTGKRIPGEVFIGNEPVWGEVVG